MIFFFQRFRSKHECLTDPDPTKYNPINVGKKWQECFDTSQEELHEVFKKFLCTHC